MARGRDRDRDRDRKRAPKDTGKRIKKKVCIFCKDHITWVDYKDVNVLRRFMSDRGKIRARRVSGNCTQHQRDVAIAIKTARELALLPYVQRAAAETRGGRGGRGGGRGGGGDMFSSPRPPRGDALPVPDAPPAAAVDEDAGHDVVLEEIAVGADVPEEVEPSGVDGSDAV
jgi:small subunit ribosomal protein S18